MQTMQKSLHAPDIGRMLFCVSDFRARRAGPDQRPGSEVASVIATAQTHARTKGPDAADPQGRGVANSPNRRRILDVDFGDPLQIHSSSAVDHYAS